MAENFEKISVIGLGYIGLPTAATLASRKQNVVGVDVSKHVVDTVNEGRIHIVEPDLDILVRSCVSTGYLRCTQTPEPSDVFIIAVPTPLKDNNAPCIDYIMQAAEAIAPVLEKGNLVVLESTSPVGATEALSKKLAALCPEMVFPQSAQDDPDVFVAHCPERVLPGHVLHELIHNDRVIGGITPKCAEQAGKLYKLFVKGDLYLVDSRTAEMAKLTENSFRDVNIAFANELSLICDKSGINVWELISLANRHPRVNILQPGPGVGGHCIAVDPWFLVDGFPEEAKIIRTAREVNDGKKEYVVEQIKNKAGRFKRPVIACLGLAFKPNIDDLRESPALSVVRRLVDEKVGDVLAVEPNIHELPAGCNGVELCSLKDAVNRADIVVALVKHTQFSAIDPVVLKSKILLDFVNIC